MALDRPQVLSGSADSSSIKAECLNDTLKTTTFIVLTRARVSRTHEIAIGVDENGPQFSSGKTNKSAQMEVDGRFHRQRVTNLQIRWIQLVFDDKTRVFWTAPSKRRPLSHLRVVACPDHARMREGSTKMDFHFHYENTIKVHRSWSTFVFTDNVRQICKNNDSTIGLTIKQKYFEHHP